MKLIKKLEQAFSNIDLISDYQIAKFDSKETIYKVIFNSSPDKFLEIMKSLGFKINVSKELWQVK